MGKDICAIWILDEETNKKLEEIRAALDLFDIEYDPIYGHITFATFIDVDAEEILQYTKKFAEGKKAFDINFSALGILATNGIVCLPSASSKLVEYFDEYHKEFDSYCNMWTNIENGMWFPHISLYHCETEYIGDVITEMSKRFNKFNGRIVRLELSVINEDGYDIIYSYDLER